MNFTPQQEEWICNELDKWYTCIKDLVVINPIGLGLFKELLKDRLCENAHFKLDDVKVIEQLLKKLSCH